MLLLRCERGEGASYVIWGRKETASAKALRLEKT